MACFMKIQAQIELGGGGLARIRFLLFDHVILWTEGNLKGFCITDTRFITAEMESRGSSVMIQGHVLCLSFRS